ncbi:MAG: hypothetical protein LLG06_01845 [Desulfobacteraceae bacterium]|nr:hypothetical protein [Desulfobacteraceae bacterium]
MSPQNPTVNVFEAASLIQLQTGTWQASKMLNDDEIKPLADPEWVKGRKHLVDPDFLAGPRKVITRCRKYLGMIALPFPVTGLLLVAKDTISSIDKYLTERREQFFEEVSLIARDYPQAREEARSYLQPRNLWNERDYPEEIIPLYTLSWRYLDITVPAKLQQLAPEIYKRELAQFEALMNEAKDVAVAALYEEVSALVDKMVDKLGVEEDGKPKKFKDSLVNNFTDFFATFQDRNIFANPKLDEIVEKAKQALTNVTPDGLRQFPDFRQKIKSEMEGVKQIIEDANVDLPRRKFKLDRMDMAA